MTRVPDCRRRKTAWACAEVVRHQCRRPRIVELPRQGGGQGKVGVGPHPRAGAGRKQLAARSQHDAVGFTMKNAADNFPSLALCSPSVALQATVS